jgi:hypothetical protein
LGCGAGADLCVAALLVGRRGQPRVESDQRPFSHLFSDLFKKGKNLAKICAASEFISV